MQQFKPGNMEQDSRGGFLHRLYTSFPRHDQRIKSAGKPWYKSHKTVDSARNSFYG